MIGNCMEKEPRGVVALFRDVGVGAGLARISSESFVDCVLTRIEKVTPFSRLTGSGVNVKTDGAMESRAPQIFKALPSPVGNESTVNRWLSLFTLQSGGRPG